ESAAPVTPGVRRMTRPGAEVKCCHAGPHLALQRHQGFPHHHAPDVSDRVVERLEGEVSPARRKQMLFLLPRGIIEVVFP
ncbi:MAG: hypothetical protein WCD27_10810, partial [Candidatus Acidiferrales bacterium]